MVKVELLGRGRLQTLEPLRIQRWLGGQSVVDFTVPAGFPSDGASFPWGTRWLLGARIGSNCTRPAIGHDFCCENAETYADRVIGDAIFFAEMRDAGITYWRRALIYLGVRTYGRAVWLIKRWWRATNA